MRPSAGAAWCLPRACGVMAAVIVAGCQRYDEPAALPDLDAAAFRCTVQPVLVARCGFYACHGSATRPFRIYGPNRLRLGGSVPALAAPLSAAEERANFDMARAFAIDERLEGSWLLLKPLDLEEGGYFHGGKTVFDGRDVFATADDPGYRALEAWVEGGASRQDCTPADEVGP